MSKRYTSHVSRLNVVRLNIVSTHSSARLLHIYGDSSTGISAVRPLAEPINKKQGYYETQNIYRYIRFKLHEYQSSEVGCNDCKMAGIF